MCGLRINSVRGLYYENGLIAVGNIALENGKWLGEIDETNPETHPQHIHLPHTSGLPNTTPHTLQPMRGKGGYGVGLEWGTWCVCCVYIYLTLFLERGT